MVYDYRLKDNMKKHIQAGHVDEVFKDKEQPKTDIKSLNQKAAIQSKKKELEK